MNNITRLEAIEDNAGGLHLAVFSGAECTHLFSGFERQEPWSPSLREEVEAIRQEGVAGWDGNSEDPQAEYDDLVGRRHASAKVVAEWEDAFGLITYPGYMGFAAKRWAELDGEPAV